ncbi:MAG: DUF6259 domain-containing protein [Opitutales bacterium]
MTPPTPHILSLSQNDDLLTLGDDGRLRELRCGGVALSGLDAASCWRLFYERGQRTQIEIRGDGQAATLRQVDDHLLLTYVGLNGPDGPLKVDLTLRFTLADGAVSVEADLHNRDESVTIKELQLPLIGDRNLTRRTFYTSACGGHRHRDFVGYVRKGSRFRSYPYADADHEGIQTQVLYPTLFAACNCFISCDGEEGLYMGCHDSDFHSTVHLARLDGPDRDRPEVGFARHMRLRAGESEHLGRFVIAPFRGTWHQGADRYRAWVDSWWQRAATPAWLQQSPGWQRLIFKHQNGEVLFRYDDMPRIHEAGRAAGLDSLFLFGWWPWGFDRMYPEYEADPELGGEEGLARNVREFQKDQKGHVLLYASGRLVDRASPWYRKHGARWAVKRKSGLEVGDAYLFSNACTYDRFFGSTELTPICQSCPEWTDLLHDFIDHTADLGCRAVFFDQLGGLEQPCHDAGHGHPVPYFHQTADKRSLLKGLQEHTRLRHPDMAMGIEVLTDCTAQYTDFIHGVYLQGDIAEPGATPDGQRPDTLGFLEFWRYLFPEVRISDRDIRDGEDLKRRCNLVVLRGLLSDAEIFRCRRSIDHLPEYQAYLGQLNGLRRRLSPWLIEGTFRDTLGFTLEGDVDAKAFVAADGSLAVVVTQSHLSSAQATVSVSGRTCVRVDGVGDYQADPGSGHLTLQRDGLAVAVFE